EFHWVSPQTDITFTCEDQPPHPSGGEQLLFKVNYDLEGDITAKYCTSYGGIIENGWCVVGAEEDFVFNFNEKEDSVHTLEYFCRDAVDKKSNIEMQWYKVDSTKPVISKDMFGQFSGDCPSGTDLEHGDCYVADNESSGVNISAVDGIMQGAEMCVVGSVKCNYKVWWHTSEEMCDKKYDGERCLVEEGKFNEAGTNIIFNEDSTHDLEITCWDALRNQSEDTETFFVDSTPPVTTKTYGEPFFSCQNWCEEVCEYEGPGDCVYSCVNSSQCGGYDRLGHLYPQWINSTTPITLTAEDEKIGVDKIFWRNNIVPDYYCEQAYLCQPCEFTQSECGEFTEYNGPFFKGQESCHLIEYKSVDKFGNEEELKWQCTFVDNTSPEGIKEVGEPNVPCEEGQECDYFVSTRTPINLACTDGGNHPVNHETVNYRFSFHEDGEWTNSDWFMAEGSANVFFEEDSLHDLEFFCTDALGNTGVTDRELFFVDTVPPVITKTVVGPQIGTCPPQNEDDQTDGDGQTEGDEGDRCRIDGTTEIHVNAVDQEPHPVGNVTCTWGYEVVDDDQSNGVAGGIVIETRLTPPFTITFPEESKHLLWIECRDGLYNTVTDYEIFFVDKTPPKTIKVYGEPFIEMGGAEWISSVTPISLRATDSFGPHDTGVQATFYRTTIVNDAYCANEEDGFDCEAAEGSGNFLQYSGEPFNIPEQSCHLIEFYSVDGVEKTEKANKQCAFVDNTGPDAVKFVGEPKTQWDGRDSIFYPEIGEQCWQGENGLECWKVTLLTSVNMSCTDPEPHPVDSETIYFMAGLDGEDVTFDYCERYQGDFDEETGWCHVERSELEFFFFEETEHNLKFFCEDALGNRGEVDDEKFKVEGRPFEIQLNKKWNLISVPFVLLEDNPEIVFESVEENLDAVWNYDALSDQWFVFRPTENGSNNLESIETGDGYWIAMLEEDMLLIGGSLFSPITTPPDKPLKKGWNLIGYYGTDGMEGYFGPEENGKRARCALFSLGESFLDKGWTSLLSYWEPFNPNQWVEFNYLDRMDAGAGYWINASDEDSIYSYTTACKFLD
ncbi:MAG: hypothetical protein HYW50_05045, partial [Candidatus Diapherotrites archaeon]|nr:hypothetical protein [Candidatus Diapherotrites archaeon]